MPEYKNKDNRRNGFLGELIGWATKDPPSHPFGYQGGPLASSSLMTNKASQIISNDEQEEQKENSPGSGVGVMVLDRTSLRANTQTGMVVSQSSSLSDSFVMEHNDSLSVDGSGLHHHPNDDNGTADNVVPFEFIEDDHDEVVPPNNDVVPTDKYNFVVDDDIALDVARLKALAASKVTTPFSLHTF